MKKAFSLIMAVLMLSLLSVSAFAASGDTLNDGLVSHYTFDEYDTANETYADAGSKNVAVKLNGGTAQTVAGPVGNAAAFDGKTVFQADTSVYGDAVELSKLTFSVWVYADSFPAVKADGNQYYFTTFTWANGDLHMQFVWGDHPGSCQVALKGNKTAGGEYSNKNYYRTLPVETSKWTLMTFTYDSDAATIGYYANGKLIETATYESAIPVVINGISIGANYELKNYFVGNLDDLRIYDRVLSEDEIKALYALGGAETPDTTVAPEVTEAPVEDTTAAPVEDTAAVPVEDTTAAPETTEQPASPSTGDNAMIIIVLAAIMSLAGATTALVSRHS